MADEIRIKATMALWEAELNLQQIAAVLSCLDEAGIEFKEKVMAKLKCDLHKRRVFFIKGKMIHRGGWGDVCPGKTATIGTQTYTPGDVEKNGLKRDA